MKPLRIRIPGIVAYPLIGIGFGLVIGIVFAAEYGDIIGPPIKDGGAEKKAIAHQCSKISMPVGALLGAILGIVAGLFTDAKRAAARIVRIAYPQSPEGDQFKQSPSSEQITTPATGFSVVPGIKELRPDGENGDPLKQEG